MLFAIGVAAFSHAHDAHIYMYIYISCISKNGGAIFFEMEISEKCSLSPLFLRPPEVGNLWVVFCTARYTAGHLSNIFSWLSAY